jgi:hypothetical protein
VYELKHPKNTELKKFPCNFTLISEKNNQVAVSAQLKKFPFKADSENNGLSNKFIFRATYGDSIVCNIFPA